MRKINEIIIHCSATPEGKDFTVADITRWHKARGFRTIGYHFVIYRDGSIHSGRPIEEIGAHCVGHNKYSIGICYIGGCAADGRTPKDTRTPEQKKALLVLLERLKTKYPDTTVHGHREFVAKACPSFNVKQEYRNLAVAILLIFSGLFLSACRTTQQSRVEKADSTIVTTQSASATSIATDKFLQSLVLSIDSIVYSSIYTQPSSPQVSETEWSPVRTSDSSGLPKGTTKGYALQTQTSPTLRQDKVIARGIRLQSVTSDSVSIITAKADTMARHASHCSQVEEAKKKKPPAVWLHLSLSLIAVAIIAAIIFVLRIRRKVSI